MVSFPNLPVETIIRLLSFLSPNELAPCARLSKQLLNIIQTSSLLTYILELGKAGLKKPEFVNYPQLEESGINPSDLLTTLRKRERGLSQFAWNEQWDIPVEKQYTIQDVCGSVFVGGISLQEDEIAHNRFDAMDVYDFSDIQNPKAPITTLFFDKLYDNCAIDPGQDLLILVEKITHICHYKLHFRCLSTGHHYEHCTILIPVPDSEENEGPVQIEIEICGDTLLFRQMNSLTIVRWKTGHTQAMYSEFRGSFTCRLISEIEFLLIGRSVPVLEYYTLYEFGGSDPSIKLQNRVDFSLPFIDDHDSSPWRIERNAMLVSSEALYTPKPFSPFVGPSTLLYPSESQLVHLHCYDVIPTGSCVLERCRPRDNIDMFVHIGQLRKLRDRYSTGSSMQPSKIPAVPWNIWGTDTTRVFGHEYTGWGKRSIRGSRALIVADGYFSTTIFDFNPTTETSSTSDIIQDQSEVVTDDGLKIRSSLPYRKIPLPYSQSQYNIRPDLIGDDIIYVPVGVCPLKLLDNLQEIFLVSW
ncbi:hypothetical protein Clacol_004583 [Clathrus columnatus]|uniref:F-box domain-containing protein n=1 Tax=Clathrus columnatus TaxID=1419009 RepID=A0AAV5A9H7_9AGAM|nr:hypothetical protein Clacol_004583 [Clathrus columnatus]